MTKRATKPRAKREGATAPPAPPPQPEPPPSVRATAKDGSKRGALPKAADKVKATQIHLRITEELKKEFEDAAEREGMELSAWVRWTLRKAARAKSQDAKK